MKIYSRTLILLVLVFSIASYLIQLFFKSPINYFLIPQIFILPGLIVYLKFTKKAEIMEVLVFSVTLSMAAVITALFIWTYFLKFTLLSFTLYYPVLMVLLGAFYLLKSENMGITVKSGQLSVLFYFIVTALFTLVPFHFVRLQLSFDGNFFSTIVYQILHGNIPPANHALFDAPVNTYWPYMLYMAFLVILLNATPLIVNALTWPILLFTILVSGYLISNYFFRSRLVRITSSLMIVFGVALHDIFIWVARVLKHPDWLTKIQYSMPHDVVGWVSYYWRDPRLTEFVNKIINYHGFLIGYFYFLVLVYIMLRMFKDGENKYTIFIFLIITGLILFHPTTVMSLVFIMPLYFWTFLHKYSFKPKRVLRKFFLILTSSFLLPFLILSTYIKSVGTANHVQTIALKYNWVSANGILFSYIAVWPFIFIGLRNIIKREFSHFEWQIMLFSTLILSIMSIFFNLPDGNQYKFIFLLNVPLTFIILKAVEYNKFITGTFLVFCFIQFLFVLTIYINSAWGRQPFELTNNGRNVDLVSGHQYKAGFDWLRLNTPLNSLVISLPYYDYTALLSQRRGYFMTPGNIFVIGYPQYRKRMDLLERLDKDEIGLDEAGDFMKKDIKSTPLFIILLDRKIHDTILMDEINNSKTFETVYKDNSVMILEIY